MKNKDTQKEDTKLELEIMCSVYMVYEMKHLV